MKCFKWNCVGVRATCTIQYNTHSLQTTLSFWATKKNKSHFSENYCIIFFTYTFVWWTPIATISDPTSITTVKIPSIIIRKNSFVFFINHVRDWMVLSSCPDLGKKSDSKNKSHLLLVWKIFLKMRVFLIIFFSKKIINTYLNDIVFFRNIFLSPFLCHCICPQNCWHSLTLISLRDQSKCFGLKSGP